MKSRNINFAICFIALIPVSYSSYAAPENLDELQLRKARQSTNTFYQGADSSSSHFFQSMTLNYTDVAYGTEVWRITNTPNSHGL